MCGIIECRRRKYTYTYDTLIELRRTAAADEEFYWIIGADTLVVYNGEILGKPSDRQEAYDMLSMLSDRTHQVYTGVCLLITRKGSIKTVRFCERTDVTFYPISREDLLSYTATGDSLDKAGAYGIQGPFAVHVKSIQGDYNNVVGLPLARLYHELLNEGLEI